MPIIRAGRASRPDLVDDQLNPHKMLASIQQLKICFSFFNYDVFILHAFARKKIYQEPLCHPPLYIQIYPAITI